MQAVTPSCLLRLASLGLVLSLGACVTTPEPAAPQSAAKPAVAKAAKKPAKKPATVKSPKASEPPVEIYTPTPQTPAEPMAWPPPLPAPQVQVQAPPAAPLLPPPLDVVGKSDHEVVALLGQPAQERVASAVKVMQFQTHDCAVEVHFFPDVKQGGFRALEVTGGGPLAPPQCLGRVRAGKG